MSTQMVVPDYILRRQTQSAVTTAVMGGLGGSSPPSISIKGNRFTFQDGQGNAKEWNQLSLNVVIIDANPHVSKVYYDKAWDPNADYYEAPACWSDNGTAPSAQAEKPQSSACASCPQNAWGSKVNAATGSKTKACQDAKKLAVMVPDFENRVFLLRVPPASLRSLSKYANTVAGYNLGPRSAALDDILTTISFEPGEVGKLSFAPAGFTPEHVYPLIAEATAKVTAAMIGKNDTPRSGALPAPAAPVLPAPAPEPQPTAFAPQPAQQGFGQPAPQGFAPQPAPQPFAPQPAPQGFGPQPVPQGFAPQPAPQPEAPKGRGRPRKTDAPAPAPQGFGTPAPNTFQTPAFSPQPPQGMPFSTPAQAAPATTPPAAAPAGSFGMAQAPVPPAELANDIAKLMGT